MEKFDNTATPKVTDISAARGYKPRTWPPASFYTAELRAIGNDLEVKKLMDFKLERDGDNYIVSALSQPPGPKTNDFANSLAAWWRGKKSPSLSPSELQYSPDDIDQLDQTWRGKRQQSQGMPNHESLPEVLRAIGEYLDRKEARLIGLRKKGQLITIRYEGEQGKQTDEDLRIPMLYDSSIGMYLRRKNREKAVLKSEF